MTSAAQELKAQGYVLLTRKQITGALALILAIVGLGAYGPRGVQDGGLKTESLTIVDRQGKALFHFDGNGDIKAHSLSISSLAIVDDRNNIVGSFIVGRDGAARVQLHDHSGAPCAAFMTRYVNADRMEALIVPAVTAASLPPNDPRPTIDSRLGEHLQRRLLASGSKTLEWGRFTATGDDLEGNLTGSGSWTDWISVRGRTPTGTIPPDATILVRLLGVEFNRADISKFVVSDQVQINPDRTGFRIKAFVKAQTSPDKFTIGWEVWSQD